VPILLRSGGPKLPLDPNQTGADSSAINDPYQGERLAALVCAPRGKAAGPGSVIASRAGYPGGQVINSREECSQNWGWVRLVISDDQIDSRRPVQQMVHAALLLLMLEARFGQGDQRLHCG
jgi:hypothetical protein